MRDPSGGRPGAPAARLAVHPLVSLLTHPGAAVRHDEYTMALDPQAAEVSSGAMAAVLITFQAPPSLRRTRVRLGVDGLPRGVAVEFYPLMPTLGGVAVLILTTSRVARADAAPVIITARPISGEPEAASVPFRLTVAG